MTTQLKKHSIENLKNDITEALRNNGWVKGHSAKLHTIQSILDTIILDRSDRPLVIIDLNGLLIDRVYEPDESVNMEGSTRVGNFLVWKRPNTDSFLDFLFEHFDVAVWSSVQQWNIEKLVQFVFEHREPYLKFIFHQGHCEPMVHPDPLSNLPLFLKNLSVVWEEHPQYDEKNTTIIDDTHIKLVNNLQSCLVAGKSWTKEMVEDMELAEGGYFIEMLKRKFQ